MQVQFYINNSDDNVVRKKITAKGSSITCNIKHDVSIINPTIYLMGASMPTIASTNYFFIPDYNRYYYLTDLSVDTAGTIWVSGRVDVLMSNVRAILGTQSLVVRQEHLKNKMLADPEVPIENGRIIEYTEIGKLAQGMHYYLTVSGGTAGKK